MEKDPPCQIYSIPRQILGLAAVSIFHSAPTKVDRLVLRADRTGLGTGFIDEGPIK